MRPLPPLINNIRLFSMTSPFFKAFMISPVLSFIYSALSSAFWLLYSIKLSYLTLIDALLFLLSIFSLIIERILFILRVRIIPNLFAMINLFNFLQYFIKFRCYNFLSNTISVTYLLEFTSWHKI